MIKKFKIFESSEELPEFIDIDFELEQIRKLNKEKEDITRKSDYKDLISKIESKEYQAIIDKISVIEEDIKRKIFPIMMKYLDNYDFEGAKWFVGKSYRELNTVGKTLLFRTILMKEDQLLKKYNL